MRGPIEVGGRATFVTVHHDLSSSGRVVHRGAPDASARTRGSGGARAVSE